MWKVKANQLAGTPWTFTAPPKHYNCLERYAYLEIGGQQIQICVFLDAPSNVFLLQEKLINQYDILYDVLKKAIN